MGVHHPPRNITICLAALSFLLLLLVCYGNSFQASWQYDDYPNIIHNERVHMTRVNGEQVMSALNAGPPKQVIARPLAYLTFALNYRLGKLNVFGYHVVNFAIHWLAALFLFLWIRGTLTLPVFQHRYDAKATLIAWLAAAFWACHPIQVTAVTYIVQRMTSMEGMFYVLAMYGYMAGRSASNGRSRNIGYALCVLGGIGALLSKENAIMLIYAVLLYDLFFFQPLNRHALRRSLLLCLGLTMILCGLSLLYLDPQELFKPYENRPFTMVQRLLTQPRVLFFYLSLIGLPMTMRMSMLHDVAYSDSLWSPWTTVAAIIALVAAIGFLCHLARRHRLFAYCGFFFFLNHAVESSFLNLELIYEHRNYVPSMLLFLPLALASVRSLDHFYYRRWLQSSLVAGLTLWCMSVMHTTWNYNRLFRSEYNLWRHAIALYPMLSLPYVNLGKIFWKAGEHEASYKLNLKATENDNFENLHQKGVAYYNLGLYASDKQHDLKEALFWFQKARFFYDINPQVWHELAQVNVKMGDFSKGLEIIEEGLERWPDDTDLLSLKALSLLKTQRFKEALKLSGRLLGMRSKHDKIAWMIMAESHRLLGDIQAALSCWKALFKNDASNMAALIAIIEINAKLDHTEGLDDYVCRLNRIVGGDQLAECIGLTVQNPNMMPYLPDMQLVRSVLSSCCMDRCPTN